MAGSRLLPDTNAVIAWTAGDGDLALRVDPTLRHAVALITMGELFHGAEKSGRRASNLQLVERLPARFDILVPDLDTARRYGRVRLQLQRIGRPIPQNDIWIAALALQHDLSLAARDSHFQHVEGLRVVGW